MAIRTFLNQPYTVSDPSNNQKQFDLYTQEDSFNKPLIVFVHGGAWRSEDKSQHSALGEKLALATGCSVAIPNYRLTPSSDSGQVFRHPGHSADTLEFLTFARAHSNLYDASKMVLIGHSCSAHMISSILLNSSLEDSGLSPSQSVLDAVHGVIFSEGIYSLSTLVATFPDYLTWFIEPAFGSEYAKHSVDSLSLRPNQSSNISWLILHSQGDDLVDVAQSQIMYDHLVKLGVPSVYKDFTSLKESHDGILSTDSYVSLVCDFIQSRI